MEILIKQINEIMGPDNLGAELTIKFYKNKIVFGVYEQEIPIVVDKKSMQVYLDCETTSSHLTYDMLNELTQITKLIENNIDIIIKCI